MRGWVIIDQPWQGSAMATKSCSVWSWTHEENQCDQIPSSFRMADRCNRDGHEQRHRQCANDWNANVPTVSQSSLDNRNDRNGDRYRNGNGNPTWQWWRVWRRWVW